MAVKENEFNQFELLNKYGAVIAHSTHPQPLIKLMHELTTKGDDKQ